MALPASDSFTGTNGTGLTSYSASWTYNYGSGTHLQIQSNGLFCARASDAATARWNADTFNADQYAQVTMAAVGNGGYYGPAVRISTSGADTCYYIEVDSSDGSYLFKTVSGSGTQLGSTAGTAANADVWRLEASGTTITPKKNGSTTGTPGAQTDSSISSGAAGLHAWGTATGSRMDDWSGGNLSTGISGTASITLAAATVSSTGTLPIVGTATPTLAAATLSSAAALANRGALTATLAAATVSSTGTLAATATGALTATLANATVSSTGTLPIVGTATPTLAAATVSAAGTVAIKGTATVTLAAATLSSAGSAGNTGTLAKTLDAATVASTGLHLSNACVNGTLRVSTANARYFENDTGIVVLTGAWWWHTLQDGGATYPPTATDWDAYLTYITARGGNLMKHSVQESPGPWPDVDPFWYRPLPWARTGPGTANDGRAKFDLNTFDSEYFDRLRHRTAQAGNAGFYVVIQLFQGWMVDQKGLGAGNPVGNHPFTLANNINSVNGNPDNDTELLESRDTSNTTLYNLEKAYIRQVIDAVNHLDNVLYEIGNEETANATVTAWQHALIDYINTYQAGKPRQHPVGMTWQWPSGDNATDLYTSNADWISYGANNSTPLTNPVAWPDTGATGFVSIWDTDHMGGVDGLTIPTFPWRAFCRGHNPLLMDKYDGTLYGGDVRSDATAERIRYNMGYIRTYAARIDMANATPQGSLASTGYCLAKTSGRQQFIVYQPGSGSCTLDLTGHNGTFSVEYLRTSTGTTSTGSTVAGNGSRTLNSPWAGEDYVAFVELSAISGTLTKTLDAATVSATGTLGATASGTLATTLANATVNSTGTVAITATSTTTLAAATVTSAAALANRGALTATLASATLAATGATGTFALGALTATLADATATSTATLTIAGSTTATLEAATLSSAAALANRGALAATLASATVVAVGVEIVIVSIVAGSIYGAGASGTVHGAGASGSVRA